MPEANRRFVYRSDYKKKPAAISRDGLWRSCIARRREAPSSQLTIADLLGLIGRIRDGVAALRNILPNPRHRVATRERGHPCNEKQSD